MPEKYPEILGDLAHLLHARLRDHVPEDIAEALALELVEDMRLKFGGGLIYFPKGQDYERSVRDAAIWREFNGRNHRELALRYGLTINAIYDILSRARARAGRQSVLF